MRCDRVFSLLREEKKRVGRIIADELCVQNSASYGDITPVSPTGRGIAFVIMAVGIAVSAIITALLNDRLSLKPDESRFVNTIIHAGLVNKRKALAARVIVHFFRFVVLVRRHPEQRRKQLKLMQR